MTEGERAEEYGYGIGRPLWPSILPSDLCEFTVRRSSDSSRITPHPAAIEAHSESRCIAFSQRPATLLHQGDLFGNHLAKYWQWAFLPLSYRCQGLSGLL